MTRSNLKQAIEETKDGEYLKALTLFTDVYGAGGASTSDDSRAISGLSYFALCIALVRKEYKPAIDLCTRAIAAQFYNGDHYLNLARVYLAGGSRKKAVDTTEQGLKVNPDHEELQAFRDELGVRARPAVPFLDRAHPINVTLGQARHAKKSAKATKKRSRD